MYSNWEIMNKSIPDLWGYFLTIPGPTLRYLQMTLCAFNILISDWDNSRVAPSKATFFKKSIRNAYNQQIWPTAQPSYKAALIYLIGFPHRLLGSRSQPLLPLDSFVIFICFLHSHLIARCQDDLETRLGPSGVFKHIFEQMWGIFLVDEWLNAITTFH